MTTVSVSELKANLSRYLQEVRRGGEVQVLDRGRPIARLTGTPERASNALQEHRDRLIGSGVLRAGSGDSAAILDVPTIDADLRLRSAVDDDRADRV